MTVGFAEYMRRCEKVRSRVVRKHCGLPRFGTLELLAHGSVVQWAKPSEISPIGELAGFRVLGKPLVLQRGNASCVHGAVERHCSRGLTAESMALLTPKLPFMFAIDKPDAHSANQRKRAISQRSQPAHVFDMSGDCDVNQANRIVPGRQRKVVGDIHAVWCVGSHTTLQTRLQVGYSLIATL